MVGGDRLIVGLRSVGSGPCPTDRSRLLNRPKRFVGLVAPDPTGVAEASDAGEVWIQYPPSGSAVRTGSLVHISLGVFVDTGGGLDFRVLCRSECPCSLDLADFCVGGLGWARAHKSCGDEGLS